MTRTLTAAISALLALAACGTPAVPAPNATASHVSTAGLDVVALDIRSGRRVHHFTVEVARTEEQQAYGLMNRPAVSPTTGMIFPFNPPRPVAFWMKDTMVPLDMVFIRADGTIARIAENTTPYSLKDVPSGEPVAAVLEIAGGRSAALGIHAGDRVRWGG